MSALRILLPLAFGMLMIGCATTRSSSTESATRLQGSERQILVMLRLPPPHFRPDASYSPGYTGSIARNAGRRIAISLAREHGLSLVSDWPMPVLNVHCFVMQAQADEPPDRMADLVSRDPRVEWAQPMHSFRARNDPLYPLQPGAKFWHLADIHGIAAGRKVRVAVVDSGIEADHPDLAGQVEFKENFVDASPYVSETHGTAVAGIIAARAGNGIGIEGIAPEARLLALRACWNEPGDVTECNSFTLGKALHSAIMRGAHVINLSIAGPPDRLLQRLLDAALARGMKIVAAADAHASGGGFPASYPGVFAVTDETAATKGIDASVLVAPGRDIPTTLPRARWGLVSGSSFAAAHVSGLMALLTELKPRMEPAQIRKELVVSTAAAQPAGSIDVCATITRATGTCSCSCTTAHATTENRHP